MNLPCSDTTNVVTILVSWHHMYNFIPVCVHMIMQMMANMMAKINKPQTWRKQGRRKTKRRHNLIRKVWCCDVGQLVMATGYLTVETAENIPTVSGLRQPRTLQESWNKVTGKAAHFTEMTNYNFGWENTFATFTSCTYIWFRIRIRLIQSGLMVGN